jgi:hypothetical protein
VLAQRWHNNQKLQDTKPYNLEGFRKSAAAGSTGTSIVKSVAESSRKQRDQPCIGRTRTHHVIAAFFIAVSALSTGLMALAIALSTSGCAL